MTTAQPYHSVSISHRLNRQLILQSPDIQAFPIGSGDIVRVSVELREINGIPEGSILNQHGGLSISFEQQSIVVRLGAWTRKAAVPIQLTEDGTMKVSLLLRDTSVCLLVGRSPLIETERPALNLKATDTITMATGLNMAIHSLTWRRNADTVLRVQVTDNGKTQVGYRCSSVQYAAMFSGPLMLLIGCFVAIFIAMLVYWFETSKVALATPSPQTLLMNELHSLKFWMERLDTALSDGTVLSTQQETWLDNLMQRFAALSKAV